MKRPLLVLVVFFLAGELLCIKSLIISIILSAGILMLALIFMLIQIVCKNVFFKKMPFFLCICAFSFFTGAVCCFSANAHSHIYDTLLSMQYSKENTLDDVLVEGNVTKVEEKSKLWIYLKNASINKKAAGEGVIVQIPVSAHSNQKRPLAGSKISVYGKLSLFSQASNPGEFDSRSYYHNLGYDFCLSGKTWTQKSSRYDPIAECLWQLKDAIKMRLSRLLEGNIADYGIYCAVLLGDKSELDKEQKELFKDQGIAHILSVSGLHISVVGLAACGLLMKLTGSFAISGMAGSIIVLFYSAFTGNAVSMIRACVMYLILMIGRQKGRIYDMPTAVAAAALCLLIFQPLAIFQASMQLSFGAVLGISLVGDIFKKILMPSSDKTTVRINRFCSVMGLSIAMLPVLLYHYYQYPLYAILLNQLVIPFAGILLVSPAVALVLSLFAPAFGAVCLKAGHLVIYFYTVLCKLSKSLPESAQYTGRPALWRIVLYVTLLFTIGMGTRLIYEKQKRKQTDDDKEKRKKNRRRCQIAAVFLATGCYIFGCVFLHADHTNKLEITVLDVGQGDGIFLMLPDHTTILSDGGSTSKSMLDTYVLEPFLNSQGIRRIDYVFVSHADSDHINGIIGLIENDADRIGTLMLPQSQSSKKQFEQLLTAAKKKQIPVKWISKGDVFSLKTLPDLSFEVLWPSKNEKSDDTNESSLVWRLNYHDFSMLFTGDLPGDCEDELVSLKPVTVLKVAHHGSDYSTTKTFLQQITPQLAVISCSENNRYGHPGKQLLKRLEEAKIPSVLITKDCGAIIIQTDGYRVEVETYLAKQS